MKSGGACWRLAVLLVLAVVVSGSFTAAAEPALTARLGLLAVEPGKGRGLVIYADLELYRGNGTVTVEPEGLVDEMLYISTKVAFYTASLLNLEPPGWFNLHVRIEADEQVGGPSASGFIASTVYDLLSGVYPLTNTTTMTGMVSLTGMVLNVAGVSEKVSAAEQQGFRVILLPAGEAAGLQEGGRARVVPVCDILEAGARLAGLPGGGWPANKTLAPASDIARGKFLEAMRIFENYTRRLLPLLPAASSSGIEERLRLAERLAGESPYAAASLAFSALYDAASMASRVHGFQAVERALGLNLSKAMADAEAAVERARSLVSGDSCDLWRLMALAAAAYRLHMAKVAEGRDDVLALVRALSAKLWADTVPSIEGPRISCDAARSAARFIVEYAETGYRYLKLLAENQLIPAAANTTLGDWVRDARKALTEGDWVTAIGLSLYVISQAESIMSTGAPASCALRHAYSLASRLAPYAAFPAALFIGYAKAYMEAGNAADRDAMVRFLSSAASSWVILEAAVEAAGKQLAGPAAPGAASGGAAGAGAAGAGGGAAASGPGAFDTYMLSLAVAAAAAAVSAASVRAARLREVV